MSKSKEFPFREPDASVPAYVDFGVRSPQRSDFSYFEPSLTRQEFAEECDINTIMARYENTGTISHVNRATPVYLDTTLYPGLQSSMDAFREASVQFNALPAKVRREFDNDAQKFVEFASDDANLARMREWGLAAPEEVPAAPIKVEVTNAPPLAPADQKAP